MPKEKKIYKERNARRKKLKIFKWRLRMVRMVVVVVVVVTVVIILLLLIKSSSPSLSSSDDSGGNHLEEIHQFSICSVGLLLLSFK